MTKFKLGRGASSDAIALMLIKMVTICLGFVVTRLLSQYLSTYDYGTYSQVLLVVSTVSSLTILGMMDGVNYFYCSEPDPQRRESCIATLFSMQCMLSGLAGALILLLRNSICSGFGNPDAERLMFLAAMLPLLQNLISMLQILMVSNGKARLIAVRNLIVSLARLGAVVLVVAVVRDVAVILAVTLLLDLLQVGVFLVILKQHNCIVRLRSTDFRLARKILTYCVPMALFTMLNALNRDCDKYLIALLTDTETLAIYTNASKVLPFDIVTASFCTVLLPRITRLVAEKEYENTVSLYRSFLEIAYVSTGILCCTALAVAPQLLELLYTRKYMSGLHVFCIYILVDLFRFTNITLILSAAGKTVRLMAVSIGALAMNLVLNVLFYKMMGMAGPAVATLVTTVGTGIMIMHFGAKEIGAKLGDFFQRKYLCSFLAECVLWILCCSGIRMWMESRSMHFFWILLSVGMLCGCGLAARHGKRLLYSLKTINR